MTTAMTPTGPVGTCDGCGQPFGHYEGLDACSEGGCEFCHECMRAAEKSGAVSFDCDGATWHKPCAKCAAVAA